MNVAAGASATITAMLTPTHRISFRPLDRRDFPLVSRWFQEPDVARWWNEDSSLEHIEAKYGPRVDGADQTSMWIIEIDALPAGLAQHYEHEDYPEHDAAVDIPDAVGIDYLLGAEHAGRGLGPAVLDAFADFVLVLTPGARCCHSPRTGAVPGLWHQPSEKREGAAGGPEPLAPGRGAGSSSAATRRRERRRRRAGCACCPCPWTRSW